MFLTKGSILDVNLLRTSGIENSLNNSPNFDYTIHTLSSVKRDVVEGLSEVARTLKQDNGNFGLEAIKTIR